MPDTRDGIAIPADPDEPLACRQCLWDGVASEVLATVITRPDGSILHLRACCPDCGTYIKFLPQAGPHYLPFKKHKGKEVSEVAQTDPDYLRWLLDNVPLSGGLRKAITAALAKRP